MIFFQAVRITEVYAHAVQTPKELASANMVILVSQLNLMCSQCDNTSVILASSWQIASRCRYASHTRCARFVFSILGDIWSVICWLAIFPLSPARAKIFSHSVFCKSLVSSGSDLSYEARGSSFAPSAHFSHFFQFHTSPYPLSPQAQTCGLHERIYPQT